MIAKIINKTKHDVKDIVSAVKKSEQRNIRLFGKTIKSYTIYLVDNDKDFDKFSGTNFEVKYGVSGKNKIIVHIINIKRLVKTNAYTYDSFFFHEINHIFYHAIISNYNPLWFSEGMATYLMKTYKVDIKAWKKHFRDCPKDYLYYRYLKRIYEVYSHEYYVQAFLAYKYLHEKYGIKKIMLVLKKFSKNPTKKNFEELMVKHLELKKELLKNAFKS